MDSAFLVEQIVRFAKMKQIVENVLIPSICLIKIAILVALKQEKETIIYREESVENAPITIVRGVVQQINATNARRDGICFNILVWLIALLDIMNRIVLFVVNVRILVQIVPVRMYVHSVILMVLCMKICAIFNVLQVKKI